MHETFDPGIPLLPSAHKYVGKTRPWCTQDQGERHGIARKSGNAGIPLNARPLSGLENGPLRSILFLKGLKFDW